MTMLLKPSEAARTLLGALQRFYTHKRFCDELVECHKCVLAAASTYFEQLLVSTDGAAVLNLDSIDEKHVEEVRHCVDFIYGLDVPVKDLEVLVDTAQMFAITSLVKCAQNGTSMEVLRPTGIGALLLISLRRYREQEKFTNVKVLCSTVAKPTSEKEAIKCHKVVLAAFSQCFEQLLGTTDACGTVLSLETVDPLYAAQLHKIFDYMYGKPLQLDEQDANLLFDAARAFSIEILRNGGLQKQRQQSSHERHKQRYLARRRKIAAVMPRLSPQPIEVELSSCEPSTSTADKSSIVETESAPPRRLSLAAFECTHDDCMRTFRSQQALRSHKKSHRSAEAQQRFPCAQCVFVGTSQLAVDDHVRLLHRDVKTETNFTAEFTHAKKHVCEVCGARFLYRSLMLRHHEKTHLRVRRYACAHCDYATTETTALNTHIRCVHTGERPFACVECSERFTTSSQLARHKRCKHNAYSSLAREQLTCTLCERLFVERRDLRVHIAKEHPHAMQQLSNSRAPVVFSCEHCPSTFFRNDHLKLHIRRVHKEKVRF